jgi:hypothetical protein
MTSQHVSCRNERTSDVSIKELKEYEMRVENEKAGMPFLPEDLEVFFSTTGMLFVEAPEDDGTKSLLKLDSLDFGGWYTRVRESAGLGVPTRALVESARMLCRSRAQRTRREVSVRVWRDERSVQIDLADDERHLVHVDSSGWDVVTSSPVAFWRPQSMGPLPMPVDGGSIELLKQLLPPVDEEQFVCLVGWLLASLSGTGPSWVLAIEGAPGSGKTTLAQTLRHLVDPNPAAVRSLPTERDLMVQSAHSWVMAFDNLGVLKPCESNALCRLSTGLAGAERSLYSNGDEFVFSARRPCILTSVERVVQADDLRDRTMILRLPSLPDSGILPERELDKKFARLAPAVLGCLLTAISRGLRDEETTTVPARDRMADAARFVTAAESALGWPTGTFSRARSALEADAVMTDVTSHPILEAVLAMMDGIDEWEQTPTKLKACLERHGYFSTSFQAMNGDLEAARTRLSSLGMEFQESRDNDANRTRKWRFSRAMNLDGMDGLDRTVLTSLSPSSQEEGEEELHNPSEPSTSSRFPSYLERLGLPQPGLCTKLKSSLPDTRSTEMAGAENGAVEHVL